VDVAEGWRATSRSRPGRFSSRSPPRPSISRCGTHDLLQAEELGAQLAHAPAVGGLGPLEGDLLEVLDLAA
jgi:hypothetical protein